MSTTTPDVSSPVQRLRAGLTYTGETPFGSCFHQAMANVLDAQGLAGAADRLGVSWGFTFGPGAAKLGTGDRWLSAVARLSGLDVTRHAHPSLDAALAAETAALASGALLVSAVDSYYIDSPYQERQHITHALIVIEHDEDGVVVIDPMNAPHPVTLPHPTYALARTGPSVRALDMIISRGVAERTCPLASAVAELRADVVTHGPADMAALAAFIEAVDAGDVSADVADVAAERLYAHRLVAAACRIEPRLEPVAESLEGLSRRWYYAHTLSLELGATPRRRMARFLRDVHDREQRVRSEFAEIAAAGEAATPPLMARIRAIVAERTKVDVAACRDQDDLWAAGLTSRESVRIMIGIEDELGLEFPPELLHRQTFGSLAAIQAAVVGAGFEEASSGVR